MWVHKFTSSRRVERHLPSFKELKRCISYLLVRTIMCRSARKKHRWHKFYFSQSLSNDFRLMYFFYFIVFYSCGRHKCAEPSCRFLFVHLKNETNELQVFQESTCTQFYFKLKKNTMSMIRPGTILYHTDGSELDTDGDFQTRDRAQIDIFVIRRHAVFTASEEK